jgi:hypothetical protein
MGRIPLITKIKGAKRPVMPNGMHYVIHQTSIQIVVPSAIWGKSKGKELGFDNVTPIMLCGVGIMKTITINNSGPKTRPIFSFFLLELIKFSLILLMLLLIVIFNFHLHRGRNDGIR